MNSMGDRFFSKCALCAALSLSALSLATLMSGCEEPPPMSPPRDFGTRPDIHHVDATIPPYDVHRPDLEGDAEEDAEGDAIDGCVPQCFVGSCGDDGCGGDCGGCTAPATCVEGACTPPASCPPIGPFGTQIGQVAADVTLYDCEGNAVQLHALCGHTLGWIVEFAEWSVPDREFAAGSLRDVWAEVSARGVRGYFVISQTLEGGFPNQDTCRAVRSEFGIPMPVLFDRDGSLSEALDITLNSWNVLLDPDLRITWKGYFQESQVRAEILDQLESR